MRTAQLAPLEGSCRPRRCVGRRHESRWASPGGSRTGPKANDASSSPGSQRRRPADGETGRLGRPVDHPVRPRHRVRGCVRAGRSRAGVRARRARRGGGGPRRRRGRSGGTLVAHRPGGRAPCPRRAVTSGEARLLRSGEAARRLGVSRPTLAAWAQRTERASELLTDSGIGVRLGVLRGFIGRPPQPPWRAALP